LKERLRFRGTAEEENCGRVMAMAGKRSDTSSQFFPALSGHGVGEGHEDLRVFW